MGSGRKARPRSRPRDRPRRARPHRSERRGRPVGGQAPARRMSMVPLTRRLAAEALGTFWLVLGGCGSAVLAATFPETGIGWLGVAFAFGLTVPDQAKALFTYSVTIDDRRDRRERLA